MATVSVSEAEAPLSLPSSAVVPEEVAAAATELTADADAEVSDELELDPEEDLRDR